MLAIACPGQGSQTPGFLRSWLEHPGSTGRLAVLSDASGVDLLTHGTTSDEDTIKDTAVAQPLIVGAGLLAIDPLLADLSTAVTVTAVAGHSVGEITAAAVAGVLSVEDAMSLVAARGTAMAAASAVSPTGMSAVLGGDPGDVMAALDRLGLTAANRNGAGQVVAAGTLAQLEALRDDPPRRARVIPLKVAGAFHTRHMAPAVATLAARAAALEAGTPRCAVVSNADGAALRDGAEVLRRLVTQVSNPVRWDLCMQTLLDLGVTGLVELPPAGTLTGLAKRGMPGVEAIAVKTPDDLDEAHRIIREHGGTP